MVSRRRVANPPYIRRLISGKEAAGTAAIQRPQLTDENRAVRFDGGDGATENGPSMKRLIWHRARLAGLLGVMGLLVACGPTAAPPTLPATPAATEPAALPTRPPDTSTPAPTREATSEAATSLSTPLPPTAQPTQAPTATPSAVPSPTPDPAVGLPCPAEPPVKPEYLSYVLSAEPWPTPDPAAAPPPLSLADPLPAAGRNTGYPYGSDGSGRYLLHNGLDSADEEAPLAVAPAGGTVIVARDDWDELFGWRCDWYGQLVVIELDEQQDGLPVYVLFGHVGDVQVSEGQRVNGVDPVARQGTAGAAVVPHLHLEVRVGANTFGATRNPLLWLEPWSGSGIIAGRLIDPDGRAWQGVTVTLIEPDGDLLNTWTYLDDPDHLIRPDPALAENFVFGPGAAGSCVLYTRRHGVDYRQEVEVVDGAISAVEIVTEPWRTPTPMP